MNMYKSYSEYLKVAALMLLGCPVLCVMAVAELIGQEEKIDRFVDKIDRFFDSENKIRDKDKCQ